MSVGSPTYGRMRVLEGLSRALEYTRHSLFSPFDLTKWVCFGVIIFLDLLWRGGFGYFPSSGSGLGDSDFDPGDLRDLEEAVNKVAPFLRENSAAVVGALVVGFLMALLWTVLFTWLSSRGQLMFVRAVAEDDYRIDENWRRTRELSWSLFVFRLAVNLVGMAFTVLMVVVIAVAVMAQAARGAADWVPYMTVLLPGVFIWLAGVSTLWMVKTLQWNFVTPIMFRFRVSCLEAWRVFGGLAWGNILVLHGFFLIKFGIGLITGLTATLAGCFTCCIGFLPVVHHTLLAPLYVFDRAYSLYVLESLGPDFRIIHDGREGPPPLP